MSLLLFYNEIMKKLLKSILVILLAFGVLYCVQSFLFRQEQSEGPAPVETIREDGTYTSKEEVALYIHTYGKLPSNYITKSAAKKKGWDSEKGNLNKVLPGYSIGGDRFSNYEGHLPTKDGRKYYECDIDYKGGNRNAKRIVYSNDGLVYYTEDHYNTFELLYGEP